MVLYGKLIIETRVSRKVMLFFLKREYFDYLYSKDEIKSIYKMLIGKTQGELISKNGKYKLTVVAKKRIKICLQNEQDNVIYKYNVGSRFLWKNCLQDAICEGQMDMNYRNMLL